jgi:hypothetical protein
MPAVNPGQYRHWVDIDDPVVDATPVTYSPSRVKASIRPAAPGPFGERMVTHIVEMRRHPQITFNTRITHRNRMLFVRGIQDVDERHRYMVLLCEEVQTPEAPLAAEVVQLEARLNLMRLNISRLNFFD